MNAAEGSVPADPLGSSQTKSVQTDTDSDESSESGEDDDSDDTSSDSDDSDDEKTAKKPSSDSDSSSDSSDDEDGQKVEDSSSDTSSSTDSDVEAKPTVHLPNSKPSEPESKNDRVEIKKNLRDTCAQTDPVEPPGSTEVNKSTHALADLAIQTDEVKFMDNQTAIEAKDCDTQTSPREDLKAVVKDCDTQTSPREYLKAETKDFACQTDSESPKMTEVTSKTESIDAEISTSDKKAVEIDTTQSDSSITKTDVNSNKEESIGAKETTSEKEKVEHAVNNDAVPEEKIEKQTIDSIVPVPLVNEVAKTVDAPQQSATPINFGSVTSKRSVGIQSKPMYQQYDRQLQTDTLKTYNVQTMTRKIKHDNVETQTRSTQLSDRRIQTSPIHFTEVAKKTDEERPPSSASQKSDSVKSLSSEKTPEEDENILDENNIILDLERPSAPEPPGSYESTPHPPSTPPPTSSRRKRRKLRREKKEELQLLKKLLNPHRIPKRPLQHPLSASRVRRPKMKPNVIGEPNKKVRPTSAPCQTEIMCRTRMKSMPGNGYGLSFAQYRLLLDPV